MAIQQAESLRDQLAAEFDRVETEQATQVAEPEPAPAPIDQPPAEPAAPAPAAQPDAAAAQRARDEAGRFAKEKADKAATASKAAKAPAPAALPAVPAAVALAPLQRPSSWKKELWPAWDKMASGQPLTPQEARQVAEYNLQREGEYAKGVSTYKSEWDQARPIMEAIQPFLPDLQRAGMQPGTWIQNLGFAHKTLYAGTPEQKLQALSRVAQDYGIPLAAFTDAAAQQQYLAQAPRQQAQQAPQALSADQARSLAREEFMGLEAQREVARFTADGQHEHYDSVKATMAQLLEANLASDLQSAYDAALKLPQHSEIYTAMQEQQRAGQETERKAAEATRVAQAKAKTVSVRSSTPGADMVTDKAKGLRSALEDAYEQHIGGRV